MNAQAAKNLTQLREWSSQIQERLQTGKTVKAWCSEQGVSPKTYYYRLRRVREELLKAVETETALTAPENPRFVALPMPRSGTAVTVRIGDNTVEIQNGADSTTIESVLRVLSQL